MLATGLCRVTDFEPQQGALQELLKRKGSNEQYLPYAVGDGTKYTFNICHAPSMTILLEPDPATLDLFGGLKASDELLQKIPVLTRRLDDLFEIQNIVGQAHL